MSKRRSSLPFHFLSGIKQRFFYFLNIFFIFGLVSGETFSSRNLKFAQSNNNSNKNDFYLAKGCCDVNFIKVVRVNSIPAHLNSNIYLMRVLYLPTSVYRNYATLKWTSLVVGDEGYIGPSGKLLCLCQTPKNYGAHA